MRDGLLQKVIEIWRPSLSTASTAGGGAAMARPARAATRKEKDFILGLSDLMLEATLTRLIIYC